MTQPDRKDMNRRLLRRLFKLFIVLPLCLLALWIFGGNFVAWCMEKHEDREWGKILAPMGELTKRFPATSENDSAREMEMMAENLDIPFHSTDADHSELEKARKETRDKINEYLKQQLAKPTAELDAPPESVEQYLSTHRVALDHLQRFIIDNNPEWGFDLNQNISYRLRKAENTLPETFGVNIEWPDSPNLLGWISTVKILTLNGLEHLRRSEPTQASESLTAISVLTKGLDRNPHMIFRLMQIASGHYYMGLARLVSSDAPIPLVYDISTLNEHFSYAIEEDLWESREIIRRAPGDGRWRENIFKTTFLVLQRPIGRFMFVGYSKKVRMMINDPEHGGWSSCEYQPNASIYDPEKVFPKWNLVGRIHGFDLLRGYQRVNRLALESELVRIINDKKQRRDSHDNLWRVDNTIIESSVCKGEHWIYEVSPDRKTMKIHYSKKLDWPGQKGLILPMEYTATIGDTGK